MPPHRVILVFAKWPAPGRVKTRLAASIGDDEAAEIYRRLVEHLVTILDTVPADEIRVLFDPADRESDFKNWLTPLFSQTGCVMFHAQVEGDLGHRLTTGFASVFAENEDAAAAAVGSDCIEVGPSEFSQCWESLARGDDAVFGPTPDGGYYLVGMREMQPALFENIPWSSEETLAASLRAAESAGLKTSMLDEKNDIDTLPDWEEARKLIEPC